MLSSRRTAAGIAQRLAGESRGLQEFALHWTGVSAKSNPELGFQFAACVADAVARLGTAGAERWLLAAMDVYDRDGLYAASAALKDLDGFVARIEDAGHGVDFDSVSGVIELFLAGLSGRRLRVEAGDAAWTDTATLWLPRRIALFPSREANFRVYKVMAALLWAQARYGSFNLAREDYPREAAGLAAFGLLEALRHRARFARELPGLARDFDVLAQPGLGGAQAALARALEAHEATAADSLASVARLLETGALPAWPFLGTLDPARAAAVRAERIAREREALQRMLVQMRGELERDAGEGPGNARDSAPARLQLDVDEAGHDAPEVSLRFEGRTVAPSPGLRSLVESLLQDLGSLPEEALVAAGEGPYHATAGEEREDWIDAGGDDAGAVYYDEWDYRRKHYRKRWCVLRERDVHPGDPSFVSRTLTRYAAQLRQLRRAFEALRGEDRRLRAEPFGDELDLDALVRGHAELRTGAEFPERVFTRRSRQQRDMAVLFMVDMSGSTKGWINDCEREALVLLCEALEVLGDRYAIYGFSGVTRKRCEIYRVKRFDEPCDALVRERIAGIQPLDYTRMGAAIRHLTGILNGIEARTRLLVTLSDGKPDDFADGYRGEYGIEDTRQALVEAKRLGIHPFCITIDREAGAYLPRMYGAVNYTVIEDVARLPVKVADVYRRLTT